MKFLITGITGFAGPHLANLLLKEDHEVYGLVRGSNGRQADLLDVISSENFNKIHWLFGDLTDYPAMLKIFSDTEFNGVFHLAAQSHPPTSFKNPILTYQTNVMGTLNLITIIQNVQPECRFHFCSTSEVYGDACKETGILKEDMKLTPSNPYGASKAAMDLYVQERIKNGFLNGFITRAFSHTGPRRGYTFSISSDAYQIAKMLRNLQERILYIGNLNTERVVIDVRDCVDAYYKLMVSESIDVFNVCGSAVHKMQYFTDILIKHSGLKNIIQEIYPPYYRDIDIAVQIGDITKLKSVIEWEPKIKIEDTLCDLLSYWTRKLK